MMFSESHLDDVFNRISSSIEFPVEAFLIGGLAMIKNKMKIATKDIDMVFFDEKEAREFIRAALQIGFRPDTELPAEYEEMNTIMVLMDEDQNRIDVFVKVVMGCLTYTDTMKSRAGTIHFGEKLTIHASSNEDIFLYKSITSRPRDLEDMENLARTGGLDWNVIEQEARNQPRPWKWIGRLYGRLKELEDETGIVTPLTKRLENEAVIAQAVEILLGQIGKAEFTHHRAKEILREDDEFVDDVIAYMNRYGILK